ncbi:hypothetical protein [Pseudomonas sp. zfem002]|uniref:hypothetical protein n=1 Tax=Pseudomonas sp. zfem002 TaxID=3078197 RepID=UPI002927B9DB|nr:hypothetical protein [Pseudomonas sp. zfem002]MDU9388998.1 hypothetical protein [Pseudomonas sp. zfem002]
MTQPSRDYTRLLNTLVDQRIAAAPRRSPWFHLNPGERADFLGEVDARLLEIQRTTLSVLAAQCYSMQDNPRDIDEHLRLLRRHREQLGDASAYRQALDRDITLYSRQQAAMQGFEGAWRKALRLLRAGDGLRAPCPGLLARLQRMIDLLQRKIDVEGASRIIPFARQQGWKAVAERYRALLEAPSAKAVAALERIPSASDALPVNLSLLLMEERPGHVRMNVALVDPSYERRYKDLYLEHGRLATRTRGLMNFSFGTQARSLAWQQQYRLKHEPAPAWSPTFAPIRSVLVRTAFIEAFLGAYLVSESTLRGGFLVRVLDDGYWLRAVNVDRKVCNQIGIEAFDDPHGEARARNVSGPRRLDQLLNRYADIASFQTIAVPSYAHSHYDPDRDGRFVDVRELERSLGFGEHLYLLELPRDGEYLAATPFGVMELQGERVNSRHLCVSEVQAAYAHNAAFFARLEALRDAGEGACPWLNHPRERSAFMAQWLRLLERNHLTPGGLLAVPDAPRDGRRDIKGNHLGKVLWERAFADQVWRWPALDPLLSDLAGRLCRREDRHTWLDNAYLQSTLAQARHLLGEGLPAMPHQARALRLLDILLADDPAEPLLDSDAGRSLRRQVLFQCLRVVAGPPAAGNRLLRPDPYLILNARPETLLAADNSWLIAEDKYRGYHQYRADPRHPHSHYMDQLDSPFSGGVSGVTEALCRGLPGLFDGPPSVTRYWRFQLANSAFWLRNGYHSLFETLYVAACEEPPAAEAIGTRLQELFERCSAVGTPAGALYDGAMALILPLVNRDLAAAERLSVARYSGA